MTEISDRNTIRLWKYIFPALIIIASVLPWLPAANIGFLNDDYQIIGWHQAETFMECFMPFTEPNVVESYWRPISSLSYSITLWLFGFEPAAFHVTNLVLYTVCCLLLGYFLLSLGFSRKSAILSMVLFSVLPSHEIVVAWIAGRYDLIACIFILLSALFYNKALITSKAINT